MNGPNYIRQTDNAKNDALELAKDDPKFRSYFHDFRMRFHEDSDNRRFKRTTVKSADDRTLHTFDMGGDYKAVFLPPDGSNWLMVTVGWDRPALKKAERLRFARNEHTGELDIYTSDGLAAQPAITGPFSGFSDDQLAELGVTGGIIASLRGITDEATAHSFTAKVDGFSRRVLDEILTGATFDEIYERVTEPSGRTVVEPALEDEALDPVEQATRVTFEHTTSIDPVVDAMLSGSWENWMLYLHGDQKVMAAREFNGPTRISGGPGTGKTVVIIHRAVELASRLAEGDRILIATYNNALVRDLKAKVGLLGGKKILDKIDVNTIDAVAGGIYSKSGAGGDVDVARSDEERAAWSGAIDAVGPEAREFTQEFIKEEYEEVILADRIETLKDYFQASRSRRGKPLGRRQRKTVWEVSTRFEALQDAEAKTTWARIAAEAGKIAATPEGASHRYRHILVDEGQDLSPVHWRLVRALVNPGKNDIFIGADSHQRLYRKPLSLSHFGIQIRGRSRRLTVNYRTTKEILDSALALTAGQKFEDFDSGTDKLDGYRSLNHGGTIESERFEDDRDELAFILERINALRTDDAESNIGIAVPTQKIRGELITKLKESGFDARNTRQVRKEGAVYVETMHSLKGLEFQHIINSYMGKDYFPPRHMRFESITDESVRAASEQRALSLLFVTVTRARDSYVLTHTGPAHDLVNTLERAVNR